MTYVLIVLSVGVMMLCGSMLTVYTYNKVYDLFDWILLGVSFMASCSVFWLCIYLIGAS